MAELVRSYQVGPWLIFHEEDGCRHAIRQTAILSVSEADQGGSSATITMTGGRRAVVHQTFETVLEWVR
jgi:hypothetical protein